jgi:signal transduction histidine kinase
MITPSKKEQKKFKNKTIEYLLLAVEEIRKLTKELVVPELREAGLINSIQSLIDDIQSTTEIHIKFTHDHESDLLSTGKKVTLFRIVQEQLKNILKYANSKKVEIYLHIKNGQLQLIVRDDGVGFDPKQTCRGIGLSNIHERTRFYNGSVDIQTAPGKGCSLFVNMPASE